MAPRIHTFPLDGFDPLALARALCPCGPGFLESPAVQTRTGRHTIVPLRTREAYRLDDRGLARITSEGEEPLAGDPFEALGRIHAQRQLPRTEGAPPFCGGFFGFIGYDLAQHVECLPTLADRDLPVPKLWLEWVDLAAVWDQIEQTLTLVTLDPADDLAALEREVRAALFPPFAPGTFSAGVLRPVLSPGDFTSMVRRAKAYIAAGDIYQTNLSCRFETRCCGDSSALYAALRRVNPSPFAGLLRGGGVEIISCSPERLVSLRGRIAETRPIAGTRPRSECAIEDGRLGEELITHPKERAEHVMLVDLERNDLGKVCLSGSVTVDELMVLERYSHVTHIVSNVRGELRPEVGPFELLRATFPGGTITGVPKKRCMEIIEELEPTGRGIYTGSAGYICATGDLDFNILIRSFQRVGDHLSYQAGAGIVADSDPEGEWQECLAKGEALRRTLEDFA